MQTMRNFRTNVNSSLMRCVAMLKCGVNCVWDTKDNKRSGDIHFSCLRFNQQEHTTIDTEAKLTDVASSAVVFRWNLNCEQESHEPRLILITPIIGDIVRFSSRKFQPAYVRSCDVTLRERSLMSCRTKMLLYHFPPLSIFTLDDL